MSSQSTESIPGTVFRAELAQPELRIRFTPRSLGGGLVKFTFLKNDAPMNYYEVMKLLSEGNDKMIETLTTTIQNFKHPGLFWECISVTPDLFNVTPFEYILLPSSTVAGLVTDIGPFREKFAARDPSLPAIQNERDVAVFHNLRRDAVLVVPCPTDYSHFMRPPDYMAHLLKFMRGGSPEQVRQLWITIGRTMIDTLGDSWENGEDGKHTRFWLSTSGLGVSWLHVRIDTVPKYYNWKDYK